MFEELSAFLFDMGYKWRFKGDNDEVIYREPDPDDVQVALDKCVDSLYSSAEGSTVEVGNLLVVKNSVGHTIYVRFGEI